MQKTSNIVVGVAFQIREGTILTQVNDKDYDN